MKQKDDLFSTWNIKNLILKNRIVMAPMCQYQATKDGKTTKWHKLHYSTRAVGGVGLIILESTGVSPIGRITDKDLGIWEDSQIHGLKEIVDECHIYGAKVALQIIHAGRKSEIDGEILAPSPIAFSKKYKVPTEMNKNHIYQVISEFSLAAKRAQEAGFDAVEIHAAHGYLISQFLSPICNKRDDEYGRDRALFLKEIILSCRDKLGGSYPIIVRISANDYNNGGNEPKDFIQLLSPIKNLIDCLHISTGGIVGDVIMNEAAQIFPGYQTMACKIIKHGLQDIPCISGGLINDALMADEMIRNNRCDAVFIGRELLRNPYWCLHAAQKLHKDIQWHESYLYAK
ncbi:NADPH dehydrogenase [Helicobacter muridarum]|uniref:NADH:flavin oxidoreductase/NADH oxidase n=1 Tax=Helicobacter muridarum TaxID=216 RepID=A0A099TWS0_9HELI|nr:hypothetical protein [Helicobacter muridarum]TLD99416.1 NADPH dehydrogenase [Helicobacter muridarum]STQ85497.1 NADH:flavin oxidoreductase/NADH oxidase [Helicobacter muridarum]